MIEYFSSLCRYLNGKVSCDEDWSAWLEGERTDYSFISRGLLRQSGQVDKTTLKITLHKGLKRASGTVTLSMIPCDDRHRLSLMMCSLRDNVSTVSDDPYYTWCTNPNPTTPCSTLCNGNRAGYCGRKAVMEILDTSIGTGFAGTFMVGWVYRAFGSSRGHHHWFANNSFCLDFLVYQHGGRAVHDQISGRKWDAECFRQRLESVKERVSLLGQSTKNVPRGDYRVYLSPAAINALLVRADFSARRYYEKDSWLTLLFEGKRALSQQFSLDLVTADGYVPGFQQHGYVRPDCLNLIKEGIGQSLIIGPRTAEKYQILFTGGEDKAVFDRFDPPDHLVMMPGSLEEQDICSRIGDGLYISDLWYVNWSDKHSGRMTGMTRYTCFKVKNGKLAHPIGAIRFDDSLYNLFGEHLEALTRHRDTIVDSFAFCRRGTGSHILPGALIGNMHVSA
ncbi:metallopeptidase TldD-related protein [Sansalvadorimonas verongulae]|uniref:metallopeptidase TldD-related protein n=1 Tax=Sansalvadorimonas verongulae TaxID=2172824 RepID=UPI0012BD3863|nr:metallopeptidase TldD-related protein [Sansalvadorimonas verongulae]MTI14006.1 hypothetical protein [Sansalvadorimonas verongulae]